LKYVYLYDQWHIPSLKWVGSTSVLQWPTDLDWVIPLIAKDMRPAEPLLLLVKHN